MTDAEKIVEAMAKAREVNREVMLFLLSLKDREALLLADKVHRADDEIRKATAVRSAK